MDRGLGGLGGLGGLLVFALACSIGMLAIGIGVDGKGDAHSDLAGPSAEAGLPAFACPTGARAVQTDREQFCVRAAGRPLRHGPAVRWSAQAHQQAAGEYRNGERHGTWIEWYPSRQRMSQLQYVEGRAHGHFQRWFDNGALESEGQYLDGDLHGPWVRYFEDGSKAEAGAYWMGKRQGWWSGSHPNGRRRYARLYTPNGTDSWTEWDESGVIVDHATQ